jgi:hypothetical protein
VLNSTNYREVLTDVLNGIDVLGVNVEIGGNLVETPAGVTQCTSSGSLTISMQDVDGNASLSAGDHYTAASAACNGGFGYYGTALGGVAGDVTSISGTVSKTTAYAVSFQIAQNGFGLNYFDSFTLTNSAASAFSISRTDADHRTLTLTGGRMTMTISSGSTSVSSRTIDLSRFVKTMAPSGFWLVSTIEGNFAMTGAVYASKAQTLTVAIQRKLGPSQGSAPHDDGVFTITAADGSKAQLEFYRDAGGLVQSQTRLDADGDNTYEAVEAGRANSFRL